jgi:hypothetical protein
VFKRLIHSFSRHRSGIVLLSGAAALLSGVERALAPRTASDRPRSQTPLPNAQPVQTPAADPSADGFKIYRSKTDLGYAYWVLQGRGCFQSFSLFDTWEQAMQEAERRLAVARRVAAPVKPERHLVLAPR